MSLRVLQRWIKVIIKKCLTNVSLTTVLSTFLFFSYWGVSLTGLWKAIRILFYVRYGCVEYKAVASCVLCEFPRVVSNNFLQTWRFKRQKVSPCHRAGQKSGPANSWGSMGSLEARGLKLHMSLLFPHVSLSEAFLYSLKSLNISEVPWSPGCPHLKSF